MSALSQSRAVPGRPGRLLSLAAGLALIVALPQLAEAQRVSSKTGGLVLGAHIEGASLKVDAERNFTAKSRACSTALALSTLAPWRANSSISS